MEKSKATQGVEIPMDMVNNIKRVVSSRLGYVTMAEYVRQAVRDKLNLDLLRLEDFKEQEKESELDDS